ncbi:hypothetical protein [Maribacter sp. R77961]|uniref:nSTAND3 domain-containing NTPase n=1 Tax=Maribacter sp. R77961 TaxID=3093871 RepID=UPI0037CB73E0
MHTVNWTEFDGDKFQSFCNDLLSFEVGKNYVPYSAPGADQGIDGFFEGEYNGQQGKWRFQAKFHHPNTGRVAGFNQTKHQIKLDLSKNINDETSVIFITNVEFNPKQRKELLNIAAECIKNGNKQIQFEIWDGAKINTLLAHHPIVKLWYTEESKYLIQEYSEFFRNELNPQDGGSYELSNKFYHREEKIKELVSFIKDDSKKVAIIKGEAGIGKTRLCIEFFQQYIDSESDWIGLVIVTHQINLEVLQKALSGEKNYIVLIDDADKYDERELADLITLVKGIKSNRVKLLLTVRSYFLEKVISQITVNDRNQLVKPLELNQLTREETIQFLEGELNGFLINQYLGYFVELTHGVPIMITTLLKVVKSGIPLANIKKDSFLKTYVKLHFENFSSVVSTEAEIQKRDIKKVIKLVTLVEPIQIEDSNLINQIANTENVPSEDVQLILHALKNQNILSGHYQLMIKPDMYSDLILEEALMSKNWLELKLPEYGEYINNIIKNIGYVYQHEENNLILENLLKEHVKKIDTCSDYQTLTRTLDTIHSITYSMPMLASEAVKKVISIYSNEAHPLFHEFQKSLKYKNYSLDSITNNLKSILRSLFQLEDYFILSFSYSGEFYQILNDDGIVSNIANFRKSDRFDGFTCKLQNQILVASKEELKKVDGNMKLFALKALKSILNLEFTGTEPHLFQKHSIQMYTLHIPENKYVRKLRQESIEVLINVFNSSQSKELREETLKILVDVPREIFAARNKSYKGKEEIKTVLDFLLSISSENLLELKQKQFIKDQMYWFQRWGIDTSYDEIIVRINENLSENDLAEKLLDLFNPKYDGKINDELKKYKLEALKLAENNSAPDLGDSLIKVIEQSEYVPSFFYEFIDTISEDLIKTIEFIDYLWATNKNFVISYCSGMYRRLRFSKNHENIYWNYVEVLEKEETTEARNCLILIYHSFRIHNVINRTGKKDILKIKDIDLITSLLKDSTTENYFNLASTLPTLFYYDKKIAVKEIKTYLSKCNERHLDSLFLGLDPVEDKFFPEIKNLLFEDTLRLNISYGVERFLNKIIKRNGFQEVLKYIENRFLFKRKYVSETKSLLGYDYVPTHSGGGITKELSIEQKEKLFSDVLNWFVDFNFKSYEHFYAKNIIKLFATDKHLNKVTKNTYAKLIEKYNLDYDKLINIIHSLSEFKQKEEYFIELVIKLLETCYENFNDEEKIKEYVTQCYISLTSLGVKSGTPGQPFSVDLQLKELLESTLKKPKAKSLKIKDFFQKVLKSVQNEIDRSKNDEDGEIW